MAKTVRLGEYEVEVRSAGEGPSPLENDESFLRWASRTGRLSRAGYLRGRLALGMRRLSERIMPQRQEPVPAGDRETFDPRSMLPEGRQTLAMVAGTADEVTEVLAQPKWRGEDGIKALRTLRAYNPDVSLAVDQQKAFAITDWAMNVYDYDADGKGDPNPELQARLLAKLEKCFTSHEGGGVDALLHVAMEALATDAAAAAELEIAPALDDVLDIVLVDSLLVRWKPLPVEDRTVMWPVYLKGTGEIPFNPNTFRYQAIGTTVLDPHGQPWLLPVLDTGPAQQEMRNVLQRVVKNQGFGRLTVTIHWDRIAEKIPPGVKTSDQLKSFMLGVIEAQEERLKELKEDDTIIVYDFMEIGWAGAQHGSTSFDPKMLAEVYDVDVASSTKTPASLLGRSVGNALSTNTDVHFVAYALSADDRRKAAVSLIQWAANQVLLVWGEQAIAELVLDPIDTKDEVQVQAARKTEIEGVLLELNAGLIDHQIAADLLGLPEPPEGGYLLAAGTGGEDEGGEDEGEEDEGGEDEGGEDEEGAEEAFRRVLLIRYASGDPLDDYAYLDLPDDGDEIIDRASGRTEDEYDWDRWATKRRGTRHGYGLLSASRFDGDWRTKDMKPDRWYWHRPSGQYFRNGRPVPRPAIRALQNIREVDDQRKFRQMVGMYHRGDISKRELNAKGRRLISKINRQAGSLAHGGRKGLTSDQLRTMKAGQRVQMAYWDNFMKDIGGMSPNRAAGRAAMYASAGPRTTFQTERRFAAMDRGMGMGRRIIQSGQPCDTCLNEASRGWMRIEHMTPHGMTQCDGADACDYEYRRTRPSPDDPIPRTYQGKTGSPGWELCSAGVE